MAFGNFFTGTPARAQQFSTITPQQAGVKGAASTQALKMLQGLGAGTNSFQPIAQQARSQFNTQTVPGLAERFTAMGGGQRSGAFQSALGQAGAGLEQGLAALGAQFGQQQQGLDQNLLQLLLGSSLSPENETLINQEQPGLFQAGAQTAAPYIGQLLPLLFSGLFNGATGGIGGGISAILSLLGGNRG